MPSNAALSEDLEGTIRESVSLARGGILVLPADSRLLDHRIIITAVSKHQLKVITYAKDKDWDQIKAPFARRVRVGELYLNPPNQDELLEMISSRKRTLETQLSLPNLKLI